MMRKVLIYAILSIFPAIVFAQTKLSLEEAVQRSLESNYQVNISDKYYEIAENNDSWGAAGTFPIANIGVTNINRYDNREATFTEGRDEYSTHQLSPYFQLSWTIFDGLEISRTKDNLETLKRSARTDQSDIRQNTTKAVIQAYYKVLLEQEKLQVFKELLDLSRDRYFAIQLKKELGNAVTFDLLQEKNAYLKDSSNYFAQQVFYRNAVIELNFLLNEPPATEYDLTDTFGIEMRSLDINELSKKMLEGNTTLRNFKLNHVMKENNIDIAKASLFPSLTLNSGIDYNNGFISPAGSGPDDFYSYDAYANLILSFLIYNGGNRERAIQNSYVEAEISKLRTDELILSLTNRMKNLIDLYKLRQEIFKVAIENKEAAKLNLDIAGEKYASGAINSFDYRSIQLTYLNSALDELNAIYDLIVTDTEILKLTGEILNSQYYQE